MPLQLYHQEKTPQHPLHRRLGGPQSRYQHGGKEKEKPKLPLLGIEPWSLSL